MKNQLPITADDEHRVLKFRPRTTSRPPLQRTRSPAEPSLRDAPEPNDLSRYERGRDEPDDRLPYFFSDQYDVGMEYSGRARTSDRVVFRGDPASREFIAFWVAGDRVVAGMNVNV